MRLTDSMYIKTNLWQRRNSIHINTLMFMYIHFQTEHLQRMEYDFHVVHAYEIDREMAASFEEN